MDSKEAKERAERIVTLITLITTGTQTRDFLITEIARELQRVALECGWQREALNQHITNIVKTTMGEHK